MRGLFVLLLLIGRAMADGRGVSIIVEDLHRSGHVPPAGFTWHSVDQGSRTYPLELVRAGLTLHHRGFYPANARYVLDGATIRVRPEPDAFVQLAAQMPDHLDEVLRTGKAAVPQAAVLIDASYFAFSGRPDEWQLAYRLVTMKYLVRVSESGKRLELRTDRFREGGE